MSRMIRALLIAVVAIFGISVATPDAFSQCTTVGVVHISGHLKSGLVRVLSCDTLYQVSGDYIIDSGAVLVVAPGVTVQFLPNGRVIDSVGGKIIADGTMDVSWDRVTTPGGGQDWCSILPSAIFATNADGASTPATPYAAAIFSAANGLPSTAGCARPYIVPDVLPNQITFRGVSVNQNSVEWGNFLILPGADSVYFRNCNFINFRKDVTVDRFNLYPTDPTNGPEILRAESNGTGAAITTFSHNTYIRGCTFRDNVARIHGGAVAFLEYDSVAGGVIPSDDGRLSVASGDVNGAFVSNVTFVNNQVLNNFTQSIIPMTKDTESTGFNPFYGNVRDSLWNVNECDGGAVYFGGSTTHLNLVLGSNVVFDRWVFNLNQAVNNQVLGSYTVTSGGTDVFGTHTQFTKYIVGGARVKLGNNYYIVSPNSPVTDNHFTITAPYSGSSASYTLTQGARGGAIYADSLTSLVVYNGAFFQNSVTTPHNDTTGIAKAIDSLALGGAIYTDTALALLDNSSFYQNTAGNGGGVYLAAMPDTIGRILEVEGPGIVFNGNTARYNGGGVVTNASFNAFVGVGINDNNNEKVVFTGNAAGLAGGGIYSTTPIDSIRWAEFTGNTVHVGDAAFHNSVLGGGAIYSESAALIQGTDFIGNLADTSNGGAIYLFNPTPVNRYITEGLLPADSDQTVDTVGDQRELTRFLQNTATRDVAEDSSQFNSPGGRLQATGLGGAIYIRIPNNQISFARTDSTFFSRVRFESNAAYSGAAVYSDLYDMRLVMSRCLVANNMALSNVERSRDTVDGISSRIAGAILYGEFEGPLPSYSGSYRGNAVYDNDGRFIVRLPDSPIQGIGAGGVDTLRGNFWGSGTDAAGGSPNVTISQYNALIPVPTFFVGTLPNTCLLSTPFESQETYTYNPIPIGQIPDTLLFEGRV
ncbi:MAG TPA: hypothetical protein VFJ29_04415, partial [Candidatus Kapabacteria bacterium]|nr:hypothetical protein [Candidatus Kapabacteria bacterium]